MAESAGYPDVGLDVARRGYHGLRIEMKYGNNKSTNKQREWQDRLDKEGYCVAVCYSFEEAKRYILWYLGMEEK